MAESFLVNVFAAIISVAVVRAVWPMFSSLSGLDIPVGYMNSSDFWLLVAGLFVGGAILSGFYPAIILSSFKPVVVLKGKINRSTQGSFLRKSLVVFQFATSILLIIGSVVVYQQLRFMQHYDLGVDIRGTLVLKGPGAVDSLYAQKLESFKTEALRVSGVKSMTASSNVPGDEIFWTRGIKRLQGGPESAITVYNVGIDYDYVPAFGLKMIAGRNFNKQFKDDKRLLLNRSLAKSLEYDDPESAIGEKVRLGRDTFEIAGVVEDYHQMSLKATVAPLVFRMESSSSFFAFKVDSGNYQDVLAQLEGPWKEFFPGNPVDYFFLDQFFSRQYARDRQTGQVFTLFTALAIFIACLGLFGLASFMTLQRTKEIGIRKVLGSTVSHIVFLLSKGFIQLVILANLIAWPFAYYLMDWWLTTFPYHIEINPLLFVLAGVVVVTLAFISVGFQTFRAAQANPAKTLKYE
jgi:putative ABC transport system permease protein